MKQSGYANIFDFYDIKEKIAEGQYGEIRKGYHKISKEKVAIKVMKKAKATSDQIQAQRNECEILKMCQHPNVIRMIDLFENEKSIFIVFEFMEGGDLFDYLRRRDFSIREKLAKKLFKQVIKGVEYMH